jgi:hypothetical protein
MRRLSRDHLRRVDDVRALVDFDILAPSRVPFGYALTAVEVVPGNRDLVRIEFRARGGHRFILAERLSAIPLERELELTKDPFSRVLAHGRSWIVIHGQYVGEPVDLWHWHTTRRIVTWEQNGVVCEMEEVIRESPSLTMSLRIAASVRPSSTTAPEAALRPQRGAS